MPFIACQGASFGYEGNTAVTGLDFEVRRGDYLCVVGENGSGKSTLLKGLLRLVAPVQGKVEYGGGLAPADIGYLPQQTAAQKDFPATAYEVILSGRLGSRGLRPFYGRRDRQVTEQNIARLGLGELRQRCYRELSGGQQQRVLLARALCATERLLLLDEPVAGLDPLVTAELYALIERINRESGLTVVMVSHDIPSAVRYAGKILHLQGRQAYFGSTQEYVNSPVGHSFLHCSLPHQLEGHSHD